MLLIATLRAEFRPIRGQYSGIMTCTDQSEASIIPYPLERPIAALGAELFVHERRGLEAAVTPQDPGLGLSEENWQLISDSHS